MATPTSLPSTFTAGNVLTASQMNNLRGAFRILQVISDSTTAQVANATQNFVDTGVSITITPQSASSKILLIANTAVYMADNGSEVTVRIVRGSTEITKCRQNDGGINSHQTAGLLVLDSPATTNATTYKIQFANGSAGVTSYTSNGGNATTLVALEVSL